MSAHSPLPGMEALVLTERQALALEIIRQRGPLSSAALGEALREARGRRDHGGDWDTQNGRQVAEALRSRGFCRRVKVEGRMLWADLSWQAPEPPSGMLAPDEDLPF